MLHSIFFHCLLRKQKLYGDDSYPGQLQRQSRAGSCCWSWGVGLVSQVSLVSHMVRVRHHVVHAGVNCVCNVCGSCGCVVNGAFARVAF